MPEPEPVTTTVLPSNLIVASSDVDAGERTERALHYDPAVHSTIGETK
jgi:hypothetical protein